MSFKPTGILEWIFLGYGGVVVVVALVLTPLVIGLGEDRSDSSPFNGVRLGGGLPFISGRSGMSRRGKRRWKARAHRRRVSSRRVSVATTSGDPCKVAIERMISCTKDDKVRKALASRKDRFVSECRKRGKDVRKAKRCAKKSSCKAFERCLSGS